MKASLIPEPRRGSKSTSGRQRLSNVQPVPDWQRLGIIPDLTQDEIDALLNRSKPDASGSRLLTEAEIIASLGFIEVKDDDVEDET